MRILFLALVSFMTACVADPVKDARIASAIKVACVGDSITQGSGAQKGKSYPAQLQGLLGDGYQVGNFGVSARTLLKKGDFPYWKEKKYQDALAMEPAIVVIMLGTNDTKPQNWKFEAEFDADYRELVKSFQSLKSKPKVFVCRPVPVPGKGNYGINEENIQKRFRASTPSPRNSVAVSSTCMPRSRKPRSCSQTACTRIPSVLARWPRRRRRPSQPSKP